VVKENTEKTEEILLYPQVKLYPLSKFEFGIAVTLEAFDMFRKLLT
jgi:hypothetical protein